MLKECSKCGSDKNYPSDFVKDHKKRDGSYSYNTYCKECRNKRERKLYIKNNKNSKPHGIPRKDLTGQQFSNLKVIKYLGTRYHDDYNKHVWLCKCNCGNKIEIFEPDFKYGHKKSCGCLKNRQKNNNPRYKGYKDISGKIWYNIKYYAKKRDLKFSITIEYIWDLFQKQNSKCALSQLDINFPNNCSTIGTASLDRKDSSKGYIKGNVQWVHKDINKLKTDFEQKRFIELCQYVAKYN